ncbi:flavin reductase family protein [Streptomyces sp. NBC_01142]|uniref:flavin reductase family protein n=1 Tax=Streptomyces sp. NBC_01142 TaxID=2975865 RepID=UPI0022586E1E|nr:flavin reductase family protein [Streptomyces sp. NBC_01142]MCX4823846.1 flavin reductase family protein [Streptomyces sp. NBC_01142]
MAATAVRYLRSVGAPTATEPFDAPAATAAGGYPLPRPGLRAVGDDERLPVAPAEFRHVLGHFATGVTVITACDEDGPAGFACQSFASLSLDPPLVAFMVARTSTTWPRIARAGSFCVNVLGAHQGELCRGFAVSGADKFAGVAHTGSPVTGSPLLEGVPAWIDCTIQTVHTGGDHLIVVGRVAALGAVEASAGAEEVPLLFHRGKFGRFSA